MARFKDTDRTNYIIQNWMRSRSTIEFIGLWEQLNNQNFKSIEFDAFKKEALGNGFQEVIYQRALAIEMDKQGLGFQREMEMTI